MVWARLQLSRALQIIGVKLGTFLGVAANTYMCVHDDGLFISFYTT